MIQQRFAQIPVPEPEPKPELKPSIKRAQTVPTQVSVRKTTAIVEDTDDLDAELAEEMKELE